MDQTINGIKAAVAVRKGVITAAQYKEITREKYQ